jgi:hypothetical protein
MNGKRKPAEPAENDLSIFNMPFTDRFIEVVQGWGERGCFYANVRIRKPA